MKINKIITIDIPKFKCYMENYPIYENVIFVFLKSHE